MNLYEEYSKLYSAFIGYGLDAFSGVMFYWNQVAVCVCAVNERHGSTKTVAAIFGRMPSVWSVCTCVFRGMAWRVHIKNVYLWPLLPLALACVYPSCLLAKPMTSFVCFTFFRVFCSFSSFIQLLSSLFLCAFFHLYFGHEIKQRKNKIE